jgi:hypothetical protein
MGLDMYLRGSLYLSDYAGEEIQQVRNDLGSTLERILGVKAAPKEIKVEVGYWRKANAIHKWFVDTAQGGVDDCKTYDVSREQLRRLRDLCRDALLHRDRAPEILSTREGFFFGSTDYNDWYFTDLENTIRIIDTALELPDNWYLEYSSSW